MNNDEHSIIQRILTAKKCSRCCLPFGYPGTSFHDMGDKILCNDCWKLEQSKLDRTEISNNTKKLLAGLRNSGEQYDAIFAYSGGKDSTAALYSAVKEFGLRVLVFNYDNGFKGKKVIDNIKKVIDDLGLDFYQIKSSTSYTILEDIKNYTFPCGRCSALKILYPQIASVFHVNYIITGIECVFNNEVIRDRGTFYQINLPAALNWNKGDINERIKQTPWENPHYGLFDTDCMCPSIALEKMYHRDGYSNYSMYMGLLEQHVVPYYSRLVRYGALTKDEFYSIICGDLSTREEVKQEFRLIANKITKNNEQL